MLVDLHIGMTSGKWYQHLVSPIIDNAHTIAMQIIDAVENPGMKEYAGEVGPEQLGIINTKFWFGYQADRFGDFILVTSWNPSMRAILLKWNWRRENSKTSNSREPYGTPFGLGSLFAIWANKVWRLGGYDEGPWQEHQNGIQDVDVWWTDAHGTMLARWSHVPTAQGEGRTGGVDRLASDSACQNEMIDLAVYTQMVRIWGS
jgi:hypothetical protein